MKKIFLVLPVLFGLAACDAGPNDTQYPPNGTPRLESKRLGFIVQSTTRGNYYSDIGVWTDPQTGCQYFTGEVYKGIMMTARIGVDGKPVCDRENSTDYQKYLEMKKKFEINP